MTTQMIKAGDSLGYSPNTETKSAVHRFRERPFMRNRPTAVIMIENDPGVSGKPSLAHVRRGQAAIVWAGCVEPDPRFQWFTSAVA